MSGTLVIQLPSNYEGGHLTVFHQQKQMEFSFSGIESSSNFTAFYADCEHEVKSVTKGYRLCLTMKKEGYKMIYPVVY